MLIEIAALVIIIYGAIWLIAFIIDVLDQLF